MVTSNFCTSKIPEKYIISRKVTFIRIQSSSGSFQRLVTSDLMPGFSICIYHNYSQFFLLHVLKVPVLTGGNFTAQQAGEQARATNGFETIYDIRAPPTCISIYLVSLTYTLFFQNHKHSCWNFMWKCLRG